MIAQLAASRSMFCDICRYGGHFGVHRDNILAHPRYVYENFQASMIGAELHTYVAERLYLILFGGIDFQDT